MYHLGRGGFLDGRTPHAKGENFSTGGILTRPRDAEPGGAFAALPGDARATVPAGMKNPIGRADHQAAFRSRQSFISNSVLVFSSFFGLPSFFVAFLFAALAFLLTSRNDSSRAAQRADGAPFRQASSRWDYKSDKVTVPSVWVFGILLPLLSFFFVFFFAAIMCLLT
jgi:hypothetical protein